MQASVLIVSKNRADSLKKTLLILENLIDTSNNEILVFLDGCTDSSIELKLVFPQVRWFESTKSLGASVARSKLYPNAKGKFLIGFDDDAHPLNADFIERIIKVFIKNPNVGIIAFEEIKGVFDSDDSAIKSSATNSIEFLTNEFIGCGFAIKKEAYEKTNGFPVWMDIYGEESCVAIEVLDKGYDIFYSNNIKVNHRIDKSKRKKAGKNYFRFEKQLINTTGYYIVYYKNPIFKIMKLYWHNFKKYALLDTKYFKLFFKTVLIAIFKTPYFLKYRNPIDSSVIIYSNKLITIKY